MKKILKGLTSFEVKQNQEKYGKNILPTVKNRRVLRILAAIFNPFNIILLGIIGVSLFTDVFLADASDYTTIIIISTMIVLSTGIKIIQEEKSEKSLRSLKMETIGQIEVVRDEINQKIDTTELTINDLVVLKMGDIVPCDLEVLESFSSLVDESVLTGESEPILKEEGSTLIMASIIKSGMVKARVVRLANDTEYGQMSIKLKSKKEKTNFEKGINKVAMVLIIFMIIVVPFIFLINGLTKHDWLAALLFALTIAVGLTPEMLPLIVTSCLAKGVMVLSKEKTIVKDLNVIQDFGAMDVLCTDKTGTLTENKIELIGSLNVVGHNDEQVLNLAYLNSFYQEGFKNAVDEAILDKNLELDFIKYDEHPYDFTRKMVSIYGQYQNHNILITKGASKEVLSKCKYYEMEGKQYPITDSFLNDFKKIETKYLKKGLRILLLAVNFSNEEDNLILVGFLTLTDIPKKSAKQAILSLKESGISTKILTGDTLFNAKYICQEIGLSDLKMISGEELDLLDDKKLHQVIEDYQVFAKLTPNHKELIIKVLKENGHTVGFMGDGVNDVLALRQADVAISFKDATEIAQRVSKVILLENDLNVLNKGVREGRKIYINMLKYIKSTLASNFGNIISIVVASLILPFLPMLSFQILILNLAYDIAMAIIPWDNVDEAYLKEPKKWNASDLKRIMFTFGPVSSIFDIITYLVLFFIICPAVSGGKFYEASCNEAVFISVFHTGWFIESMWTQTLIIQVMRTDKIHFIKSMPSIKLVAFSIVATIALTVLPYTKFGVTLGFNPLPLSFYIFLLLVVSTYLLLVSIVKKKYIAKNEYLLA